MAKLNNIEVRIANIISVGDHLEIKVEQDFPNQFFQSQQAEEGKGYLKLRLSLDTAIQLAEFIDREMDELVKEKMGVIV